MLWTIPLHLPPPSSLSSSQNVGRPLTQRPPAQRRRLLRALPRRKRRRRAHVRRRQHEHQHRLRHRRVGQHEPGGESSRRLRHGVDRLRHGVDRPDEPRRSLHGSRRCAGHHAAFNGIRRRHVQQPSQVPEPDRADDGHEQGQHQVFAAVPGA